MVVIISREKTKGRERKEGRRLSKGLCRTHYDVRKEVTSRTVQFTTRRLINLTGESHERGNLCLQGTEGLCLKPMFVLDLQKARTERLHKGSSSLAPPGLHAVDWQPDTQPSTDLQFSAGSSCEGKVNDQSEMVLMKRTTRDQVYSREGRH